MSTSGTASQNPVQAKDEAGERTMQFKSIKHISGTSWNMPAGGPHPWRYNIAVKVNR